ncbi:MAG TPA: cell envelope integrity protein TolA [Methylotenera sp.]|nr:cell envelope integrity protein TolA [Methylotenera sp.]
MMIRRHENPVAFKAGVLALAVHAVLIAAMLISFSWKNTQPMSIAEVELWNALPVEEVAVKSQPRPVPVIKEEPKVEPPKIEPKEEPKPEVKEEPKADIQLEKKQKLEKEQKEDELRKKQAELEKIKKQALLEEKLEKEKLSKEKQKEEALRKLQEELLADDTKAPKSATNAKTTQASAASAGEVDKYKAMIQAKIQRNVNKSLCGDGKPELVFEITVMPTGEVQGNPKLVKSSSIGACDDAVERAILQSQPLPLPADVNLRAQFRNITLKFHPNE